MNGNGWTRQVRLEHVHEATKLLRSYEADNPPRSFAPVRPVHVDLEAVQTLVQVWGEEATAQLDEQGAEGVLQWLIYQAFWVGVLSLVAAEKDVIPEDQP